MGGGSRKFKDTDSLNMHGMVGRRKKKRERDLETKRKNEKRRLKVKKAQDKLPHSQCFYRKIQPISE